MICSDVDSYDATLVFCREVMSMNGFSTEDDSRHGHDQICCLIDNGNRCTNQAGNASYSKRIQKTVQQRKLKLVRDDSVCSLLQTFYFVYKLYGFELGVTTP